MTSIEKRNQEIIKLFAKGNVSKAALARQFGIDESTVRRILKKAPTAKAAPVASVKASVKAKAKKAVSASTGAKKSAKASTKTSAPAQETKVATSVRDAMQAGSKVEYVITADSVVLTLGDDVEIVDASHANYRAVVDNVLSGNFAKAFELMNVGRAITNFTKGAIKIYDGKLFYGEMQMRSSLVDRIMTMMGEGDEGFKKLIAFFERLMKNPSPDSVDQLFGFISHLDIGITEDGMIIGWKKVDSHNGKLFDNRTGKVPNDVGNIVEMPRHMVDSNRNVTCSQGLHVGAWDYVRSFSGNTILRVLVDPADVVSVPTDYHDMKMRAAKYKVDAIVDYNREVIDSKVINPKHVLVGTAGEILEITDIAA